MTIKEEIKELRYKHVKFALEQTKGNQRASARTLGITNSMFDRWLRELNLHNYAQELRDKNTWWLCRK